MMISSSYGIPAIRDSSQSKSGTDHGFPSQKTWSVPVSAVRVAAKGPAGEARLDRRGRGVEHDPKHGEHDQAGEHDRDLEGGLRVEHELADALVRTHRLRHDRADEGERDRHF